MRDFCHYLTVFPKALFFTILAFFAPIKGLIILTGVVVFLDTIYAIYVTIKLNGWGSYQSDKLFNIVVKSFFYLGSILLAYLIDTHIIEGKDVFGISLIVSKFITVFWVYVELKSIDETSQKLGNKSFYFTIKNIITKLKAFKKDINELTK